jgi:hypothetical protein
LLEVLHKKYNFPREGCDKWYVRTAKSVANREKKVRTAVTIITEDLHFYEPDKEGVLKGEARIQFMEEQSGQIPSALSKEGIEVKCVSIY